MATANDKNARHLDQGKVGDTVKGKWPSWCGRADAAPTAAEAKAVELAPKGQKPGGVAVNTVESTASVVAIDYQTGPSR